MWFVPDSSAYDENSNELDPEIDHSDRNTTFEPEMMIHFMEMETDGVWNGNVKFHTYSTDLC